MLLIIATTVVKSLGTGVEGNLSALLHKVLEAIQNPIPWVVVDSGPCKENMLMGRQWSIKRSTVQSPKSLRRTLGPQVFYSVPDFFLGHTLLRNRLLSIVTNGFCRIDNDLAVSEGSVFLFT